MSIPSRHASSDSGAVRSPHANPAAPLRDIRRAPGSAAATCRPTCPVVPMTRMFRAAIFGSDMFSKPTICDALLALTAAAADVPSSMGRKVTVTEAPTSDDPYFPKGPASVCVEGRRSASVIHSPALPLN